MNLKKVLRFLRERYKIKNKPDLGLVKSLELINIQGQAVSDLIKVRIESGKPFLVSRFGSEELKWYVRYKRLSRPFFVRAYYYITCQLETWKKEDRIIDNLTFKPKSLAMTRFFIDRMKEAIPQIDLLGSWLMLEQSKEISLASNAMYAYLGDLEPYYHANPWTSALAGKKVLVIHPMTKSISKQYLENRERLFADKNVLPEFELVLLQAKYFDDPLYDTWEKMYNYYLHSIKQIEFDVAILGCGPWGMPIAAEIKKMGKQAIHLGGSTQLLFGIIGSRWESLWPEFQKLNLVNEYWTRPLPEETPGWAKDYDKNSYW